MILSAVGALLVLVALVDVFLAVLSYEAHGALNSRVYRLVWSLLRLVSRPLRGLVRIRVLAYGLPLMIVAALVTSVGLVLIGYSLIYYEGFSRGGFTFSNADLTLSYSNALYVSGVTLATLGYGDITPDQPLYQALSILQALTGFAILTLALSYVLSIYQVLQGLDALTAGLHQQSPDEDDQALSILAPHFVGDQVRGLEPRLQGLHAGLIAYHEGLQRYPVVYYFVTSGSFGSLPYTCQLLGDVIAALRFGLPAGHPVPDDPWLGALHRSYLDLARYSNERFGPPTQPLQLDPLGPTNLHAQRALPVDDREPTVGRFLDLDQRMRALAHVEGVSDDDLYTRYRGWLEFTSFTSAFLRATAKDLGIDIALLEDHHDRELL